jgi:hypothetical protein
MLEAVAELFPEIFGGGNVGLERGRTRTPAADVLLREAPAPLEGRHVLLASTRWLATGLSDQSVRRSSRTQSGAKLLFVCAVAALFTEGLARMDAEQPDVPNHHGGRSTGN